MARKFVPKPVGHPSIGNDCVACNKPFKENDFTTLISLGPGDDLDEQTKAKQGKPYNAVAVEIHWDCAGVKEETAG